MTLNNIVFTEIIIVSFEVFLLMGLPLSESVDRIDKPRKTMFGLILLMGLPLSESVDRIDKPRKTMFGLYFTD